MITTANTTAVLARAAIFDQRVTRPNPTVTNAWTDEFNKHDLELPDLLAGVSAYYEIGRDRVIQPGDVIRAARDLRQRRAQVENATDARAALPAGQAPYLENGLGLNATGQPVEAAYEVDGAGHLDCPACNAGPGQVCEHPVDGRTMKIPHVARLKAARRATTTSNGASHSGVLVR